ncbi:PKD domain-containing protein [Solitalea lacus]|uniref:PKD domain-containing protein n=1 Tax=Solitalea lacus TaxID=2911172 RepID=UPI001EDC6E47|nr:PKD domain-containing protein [Solitalea lacus]UKJ08313.1 PKD domain-containing protein [Solitalea lacus]
MKKLFTITSMAAVLLAGCKENETVDFKESNLKQPEARETNALIGTSKYITQVFEYLPAPGQFINTLPAYASGDNAQTMAAKVATSLVGKTNGLVCLGGYGGYLIVGFDHTISNVANARDFKVYTNAFANNAEPGIVMVAYDANGNGLPDDTWYELAGSEYYKPGTIKNYQITYSKPNPLNGNVAWTDNQGGSGFIKRNSYHTQASYYPLWAGSQLTFTGTKIPNNAYDSNPDPVAQSWVLPAYPWGYADNQINTHADATFDIAWAVDANGQPVNLSGINFIKIYTAVNQEAGWLGETSTEIAGIEDLNF